MQKRQTKSNAPRKPAQRRVNHQEFCIYHCLLRLYLFDVVGRVVALNYQLLSRIHTYLRLVFSSLSISVPVIDIITTKNRRYAMLSGCNVRE